MNANTLKKRFASILYAILLTSGFSALSVPADAGHSLGNEIRYNQIDSFTYEFFIIMYRDCRGVSLSNPSNSTRMTCISSGNFRGLNLKLRSITDITPVCSGSTGPCTPKNTYGTGKGIERHIYSTIVDFRDSFKAFYQCGKILIEFSQCCRNGAITTGGANLNFYNYGMVDLSVTAPNSGPVINNIPIAFLCCNQPVRHYFDVTQDDPCDSLSYHIVPPLYNPNKPISYTAPFSYNKPFTIYDPYKLGIVYPDATPPIGFFFDSLRGGMVFVPTKCDETTIMAYEVREWRKDSSGKMQVIGISRRDMQFWVENCPGNNPPQITGQRTYNVCDGDSVVIDIGTIDKVLVPPPPAPKPDPDTVTLSWSHSFSDATIRRLNTKGTQDSVQLTWRAKTDTCNNNEYYFTLTARDDNCPRNDLTNQTFLVRVYPEAKATIETTDLTCGKFLVNAANVVNAKYFQWNLLDSSGKVIKDTSVFKFLASNKTQSSYRYDSLQLNANGPFRLRLRVWDHEQCDYYTTDTMIRKEKHYDLFSWKDTLLCDNWSIDLVPDLIDTSDFASFRWNTGASDSTSVLNLDHNSGSGTYGLTATSLDGCKFHEKVSIRSGKSPAVGLIKSDSFCPPFAVELNADSLIDNGSLPTSFVWENGDTIASRKITTAGNYWLAAANACGRDTTKFNYHTGPDPDQEPVITGIPDDTLCDPVYYSIHADSITDHRGLSTTYLWDNGDTLAGRLIRFEGQYRLIARNKCGSDTAEFHIYKDLPPDLAAIPDDSICIPDSLFIKAVDLNDSGLFRRTYQWGDGFNGPERTIRSGGEYLVMISSVCGTDNVGFTIDANIAPNVDLGPDTMVSEPFTIRLVADTVLASYLWNTGEKLPAIQVSTFGKYWVTVSNRCGTSSDTINITKTGGVISPDKLDIRLVPNPNNGQFSVVSGNKQVAVLRITDITGKEIRFTTNTSVNGELVITLADPKAGLYFVETAQGQRSAILRIAVH